MLPRGEDGPSPSKAPTAQKDAFHSGAAQESTGTLAVTSGQMNKLFLPAPVTAGAAGMPKGFSQRAFGEAALGEADAWQEWLDAKQALAVDILQVCKVSHCSKSILS